MTLYEIIRKFENLALAAPNVRTACDGNVYDAMNDNPKLKYGVFFVSQDTHQEFEQMDRYGLTLFYIDRLDDTLEDNRLQIQSIGKEILSTVIRDFCEEYDVDLPTMNYIPFTEKFKDLTAGIYVQITIEVFKDDCYDDFSEVKSVYQTKTITIQHNGEFSVQPDKDYTALKEVIIIANVDSRYTEGYDDGVAAQKAKLATTAFTENGEYTRKDGWSGVTVDIDTDAYYNSGYTSGETHQKSLLTTTAFTQNGEYTIENGWSGVTVNVPTGSTINNQNKSISFSANTSTTITYDGGYTGLESVSIEVNVPQTGYTPEDLEEAYESGKTDQKNLLSTTAFTENGSYSLENGWSGITINVPQTGSTINNQDKSVSYTQNGEYLVSKDSGYTGIDNVTISVNVPSRYNEGYVDGKNDGIEQQKALLTTSAFTENGVYSLENGWSAITINVATGYSQEDLDEAYNNGYEDGYNNRPRITVSPSNISFENTGGTATISVTSNVDWFVVTTGLSNNYTFSATGGTGDGSITISVPSATTIFDIIDSLVFKTTDNYASASTTVNQYGLSAQLNVTPTTSVLTHSAQTLEITVEANSDWVMSGYPSWITPSIVSGTSGTTTVVLTIDENQGDDARSTNLTFTLDDGVTQQIISVTQNKEEPHNYLQDYLTFGVTNGNGSIGWDGSNSIEYRKNNGAWTEFVPSTSISIVSGDVVEFRGDNDVYYGSKFSISGSAEVDAYGNIMSMIDSTDFSGLTTLSSANTFNGLFDSCVAIKTIDNLMLPATALTEGCYAGMFLLCTGIGNASNLVLPATTLTTSCYASMFKCCYGLTQAPQLPAETLSNGCYYSMFEGCTSLTTAPALPAINLAEYCYAHMFDGCYNLIQVPAFTATRLKTGCYTYMFAYCSKLSEIRCYVNINNVDGNLSNCISRWLYDTARNGVFYRLTGPGIPEWPRATSSNGYSGVPTYWELQSRQ